MAGAQYGFMNQKVAERNTFLESQHKEVKEYLSTVDGRQVPIRVKQRLQKYALLGSTLMRGVEDGLRVILELYRRKNILKVHHGKTEH